MILNLDGFIVDLAPWRRLDVKAVTASAHRSDANKGISRAWCPAEGEGSGGLQGRKPSINAEQVQALRREGPQSIGSLGEPSPEPDQGAAQNATACPPAHATELFLPPLVSLPTLGVAAPPAQ